MTCDDSRDGQHADVIATRRYHARVVSPDLAAERIAAAVAVQDATAYQAAGQELVDALKSASPDDIEPALVRLAPVLREIPLGRGNGLAQVVGGMAWQVTDTSAVLGVLVDRACQAMEHAARFLDLYREVLGEPPAAGDTSAVQETSDRHREPGQLPLP